MPKKKKQELMDAEKEKTAEAKENIDGEISRTFDDDVVEEKSKDIAADTNETKPLVIDENKVIQTIIL